MTVLTEPTREDWIKAGRISAEVLQYGKSLIKKGKSILEICDACDKKIFDLGAIPAFPSQISCNHIAAHFCPDENDKTLFEDQLASLDIGACINGAIGDNAATVDLSGKYSDLVKASQEALEAALKIVGVGVKLSGIGKAIHDVINSYGFSPVRNLSGHGLGVYSIHEKPTIPNFDTGDSAVLEKGMKIAIEPFATSGKGMIYESSPSTLFSLYRKKPVRNTFARQILAEIEKYNGLPFTTRWLTRKFGALKVNIALKELLQLDILKSYAPLPDLAHGMVSQAEHTVIVDDPIIITTKL